MLGIILDEEIQAALAVFFRSVAAKGASDQPGSALPHVAENRLVVQRRSPQFRERGVHAQGQVELGIDQRAVQIEDQRAHFGKTIGNVLHESCPALHEIIIVI